MNDISNENFLELVPSHRVLIYTFHTLKTECGESSAYVIILQATKTGLVGVMVILIAFNLVRFVFHNALLTQMEHITFS